jgi:AtzE family amidohydrolase
MSASENLTQSIARIEATDDRVNAFTAVTRERAQREAAVVDADDFTPSDQWLAGVPYAVKNLFDVQGMTTLAGSKINRDLPPAAQDAVLVQRLQAAGAVLVGTLNMDEYAYGFTTENTHYGATHNPHRLGYIAGGSSGGSGAAVAAGQVPLALGSDTNGSIRVPASLCGVWGMKPTFGRLSRRGTYPFVQSLDHLGALANRVELLAAAYDAMQGPDPLDPGCHAQGVHLAKPHLRRGVKGLRVGLLGGYFHDMATAPARAVANMAAQTLQNEGAQLADAQWPDAALGRSAAFVITASEGGCLHLPDLRQRAADFEPKSVDRFIAGALQPLAWYLQAQRYRRLYREKVLALFEHWDVLVCPATPVAAVPIGTEWIEIQGQPLPSRASMGLLTQPISFAGCPVVVAPMWPEGTEGLPIGVQLIAAPWKESLALRAAATLQHVGAAFLKTPKL